MATASQAPLKQPSPTDPLSFITSDYDTPSSDCESIVEARIPVIDLSLLRGTQEQRSQSVRDMGRACQEWGFFMIVNHGMPEGLRGAILEASEEFFNLPSEVKKKYMNNIVLDPIRFGTGNNATNNNQTGEELLFWREFLKVIVHPEFTAPANPPSFREILQEYMTCTRELARELLQGIWESLELDGKSMDDNLDLNSCFQIFNGNFYPPCPQPEITLGLPPHSDIGLLTLLLQNNINGLQVKHNDKWVNVEALPNSFFINTGEHMEIISNGRYKSVMHRATLNDKSTRISIVSAIGPSMEATVVPAPELVNHDNHQARYRATKFGDYISYKLSSKLKEKLSALDSIRLPVE